jgi:hypothetical protein
VSPGRVPTNRPTEVARMEDTQRQINQLREQVETSMKENAAADAR